MDIKFEQLIEALGKKKDSHPNLSKIWIQHLKNRKNKLLHEFTRCEQMLVEMENKDDVSMENLFFLRSLFNHTPTSRSIASLDSSSGCWASTSCVDMFINALNV